MKVWSSPMAKIWSHNGTRWWQRARIRKEKEPNNSMAKRSYGWVALGIKKFGTISSWWFVAKIKDLNLQMMKTCSLLEIRAVALLQRLGLPSLMSSCNDRKVFILLFGGSLFCFVFFKGGVLFELLLPRLPLYKMRPKLSTHV